MTQVTAKETLSGLVFGQAYSVFVSSSPTTVTYDQGRGSGRMLGPPCSPSLPIASQAGPGSQSSSSLGPSAYLPHRVQGLRGTLYPYRGTQPGEGGISLLQGQGADGSRSQKVGEVGRADWGVSRKSPLGRACVLRCL